ncbi:hypothetical protein [Algoriphagus taiwanensis]|uniref:YopX protein domain-containing protein n=1 Tax=Algoriphagus taiwanensis TaxID=1445656 RepID=A0ABQ6Q023_9BACT|nr:hypothetical protein Ataiwa_17960 [Algoriphagus taiwanensis]
MRKRKITNSKNQWIDLDECTIIEGKCRYVNGNPIYYRTQETHMYNCLYVTESGKFVEFTNYSAWGGRSIYNLLTDQEVVEWFNDNDFEVPDEFPHLKEIENGLKI